jgi:hypothetical protein
MSRANWVRATTTTGGTGSLTLSAVASSPTFAQAFGTGETTVSYVISSSGLREAGTATFNGTTNVLSSRTVIESWDGSVFGTSAQNFPTSAVTVTCAPIYQETAFLDTATGALVSTQFPALTGDVTTVAGALATTIANSAVGTDQIADDSITPAKLQDAESLTTAELKTELGVPQTSGETIEMIFDRVGIANGTYLLDIHATFPYTITALKHKGSEALTALVKIGSTTVTGLSAVAVTTSAASTSASAANSVVATNEVSIVLTDIATTADVWFKLVVTRG